MEKIKIVAPCLALLMLIGTISTMTGCSSKEGVRKTTVTTERPVIQEKTTTTTETK